MMKIICLAAFFAVVAAMPSNGPAPVPTPEGFLPLGRPTALRPIVKREVRAPEAAEKDGATAEGIVEAQDDLDKAETFGFGYHKVIHVYPSYYPAYHHYYPRYYPSHYYGQYW